MFVTERKKIDLFGLLSPGVFLLILLVGAFAFYKGQGQQGWIVLLGALIWVIFSFRIVRPAFAGLVFRFGSRVIVAETIQYFRIVDGQRQDILEEEFNRPEFNPEAPDVKTEVISVEYLTKKEGWKFAFPILEKILGIALRQNQAEVNEKKAGESDEEHLNRGESIATSEGVSILPEVFYSYRIVNPGKVFELGGGINDNGDSPFLAEILHDLVIGGTRGVLARMELTKILSRETEDDDGNRIPIGEKIRNEIIRTPNFDRLGVEVLILRIEDIKFKKDAQDVLDALEEIKKQELSRQSQIIEADTNLQVQRKNSEAIIVLAGANLEKARAEALALNAAIAAFVGKIINEPTSIDEGRAYANFQMGLAVAKSLETGTKIIIPATNLSQTIASLTSIFDSSRQ